jgi:hypothetical protein
VRKAPWRKPNSLSGPATVAGRPGTVWESTVPAATREQDAREPDEEVGIRARVVRELGHVTRRQGDGKVFESHDFELETEAEVLHAL